MGRSKKFMLNSVTTALLQVVTMIAGFITPRFMLTAYGSEINGLISSISTSFNGPKFFMIIDSFMIILFFS